ncbi:MAG: glycosyltransferase [Burkholderiales bacterium]
MRILMISDVYFPRVNGVSTSIQTFRHELAVLGHRTVLIAPAYPASYSEEDDILRIRSRRVPLDPEDRIMRPGEIRRLLPKLREERFDLVHIQTPFIAHYLGVELAAKLDLPVVESYHTFFEEYLFHYIPFLPTAWLRAMARRVSRGQSRQVDALVVPSSAMRDRLAEYGVRTPMHVLPTGIPLREFARGDGDRFRRRHGIAAGRPTLLFVGRVAFEKNIDFLLRALELAMRNIPDLLLVIAGEGPALAHLEKEAVRRNLQEHVLFVGYLDRRHELLDCYSAADAFVFASRTETQGLVLLEAMALGLPVISTAVMGTRDIVGPRRGALVPREDEANFAASIVRFVGDPALRARLAQEAVAYAREWHADALAVRMADLYREIVFRHDAVQPIAAAA